MNILGSLILRHPNMHSPLLSQCSSRLFILVPLQIQDTGSLEVLGFTCPRISNLFISAAGFTRTGIKNLPDFVFSKVMLFGVPKTSAFQNFNEIFHLYKRTTLVLVFTVYWPSLKRYGYFAVVFMRTRHMVNGGVFCHSITSSFQG